MTWQLPEGLHSSRKKCRVEREEGTETICPRGCMCAAPACQCRVDMRRGWRGVGDRRDSGNAFSKASAAEFSQTLPRQFRPQTVVVANRPPRPGPHPAPLAQENKHKRAVGWREARVSIQKSNSLTDIGNSSHQSPTDQQAGGAQEGVALRPLGRAGEVVAGRNHAGIRRSASLRSLLANTGENHRCFDAI